MRMSRRPLSAVLVGMAVLIGVSGALLTLTPGCGRQAHTEQAAASPPSPTCTFTPTSFENEHTRRLIAHLGWWTTGCVKYECNPPTEASVEMLMETWQDGKRLTHRWLDLSNDFTHPVHQGEVSFSTRRVKNERGKEVLRIQVVRMTEYETSHVGEIPDAPAESTTDPMKPMTWTGHGLPKPVTFALNGEVPLWAFTLEPSLGEHRGGESIDYYVKRAKKAVVFKVRFIHPRADTIPAADQ